MESRGTAQQILGMLHDQLRTLTSECIQGLRKRLNKLKAGAGAGSLESLRTQFRRAAYGKPLRSERIASAATDAVDQDSDDADGPPDDCNVLSQLAVRCGITVSLVAASVHAKDADLPETFGTQMSSRLLHV